MYYIFTLAGFDFKQIVLYQLQIHIAIVKLAIRNLIYKW